MSGTSKDVRTLIAQALTYTPTENAIKGLLHAIAEGIAQLLEWKEAES